MSLTKDALDTITATAIAASGAPLDTHVPAILVPDGYKVKKIEHLQARPSHFRGTFLTHSVDAFVSYVQQHARLTESAGFIGDDMAVRVNGESNDSFRILPDISVSYWFRFVFF